MAAAVSDSESSNFDSSETGGKPWGRRIDAEKPSSEKQGVTWGHPPPELILYAAVIGVKGLSKDSKRSPIKGGGSSGSVPRAVVKDKRPIGKLVLS